MSQPHGAAQSALIPFHKRDSLDGALYSCRWWEHSQTILGFGTVSLSFDPCCRHWLVLVSQDLIDASLPF